jgi:hypothetical protein
MADPTHRVTGTPVTATSTGATGITIPVASGVVDGDLMVVQLMRNRQSDTGSWDEKTGWKLIHKNEVNGDDRSVALYLRFANDEPANYTFTHGGTASKQTQGVMVAYSDVDASIFDVTYVEASHYDEQINEGTTHTGTPPAITTQTPGALVIIAGFTSQTINQDSAPSGYNLRNDSGMFMANIQYADKIITSAGLESPPTMGWTAGATSPDQSYITIALEPKEATVVRTLAGQLTATTAVTQSTVSGETRHPTGCIIACSWATALDTETSDAEISFGLTDFLTVGQVGANDEDGISTTSDAAKQHQETNIIQMCTPGTGTVVRSATVAAIPGGIEVTPVQSGTQFRYMAVLFFGTKCFAFSSNGDGNLAIDETFDIAHDMVTEPGAGFYGFSEENIGTGGALKISFGMHAYDGSIKQACCTWFGESGAATTNNRTRVVSTQCVGEINSAGTNRRGAELTAIGTVNCTYTNRNVANVEKYIGLLVECDDIATDLAIIDSPTSSGSDWAYSGLAFQPQAVCLVPNRCDVVDSHEQGSDAGTGGFAAFDKDGGIFSAVWSSRDGRDLSSVTTDTASELATALVCVNEFGTKPDTNGHDMDNPTLNGSGWTFAAADIAAADGTARKWPMIAFEEFSTGTVINRVLTSTAAITDPIPGSIFTKKRPGERIELFTDALFIYYTYARLVQDNFSLTDQIILEQNLRRQLLDAASITDVVNTLVSYYRQLSDSISLTDDIRKTIIVPDSVDNFVTVQDSVDVSDSIFAAFVGTSERIELDSLLVNEAALIQRFRARTAPEQIAIIADLLRLSHHKIRNDYVAISDDLIVSRSAIINSATVQDSISVNDLLGNVETGTLLPPSDIEIEHGIENQ